MNSRSALRVILLSSAGGLSLVSSAAVAQPAPTDPAETPSDVTATETQQVATGPVDDIIVTARRRNETSIAAPVAITAVSGEQLQERGISTVDALARAVPNLITSEATSSPQGGIVAIRGLSGVDANPFGDQAVSFNIDGVPVARSSVRRLSQMDIAQVEVLKGPQALFFGKNSPAGIISVRTADPTRSLQGGLIAGYEFDADEVRTEAFLSGPISETLGWRVAGYYSKMKGYVRNVAPETGTGVRAPFDRRVPNGDEYALRGTLKFEPTDRFDARLKVSYNESDGSGSTDMLQFVNCPLGRPQGTPASVAAIENCKADDQVTASDNIGPNFAAVDPRFGTETYLKSDQLLGGLEMNYRLSDQLTLSSITGYYKANNSYVGSFTANFIEGGGPPLTFLPAYARLEIRETTQEVRLTSNLDGPFNFLVGGLYQDNAGEVEATVRLISTAPVPVFSSNYLYEQKGTAWSAFAQGMFKVTPELEISAGARYSKERKRLPVFRTAVAASPFTLVEVDAKRSISFDNLSPEVTISYRPTGRLNVYASYKQGFLSGGFNATQPSVSATLNANGRRTSLIDPTYDQQVTKGFEGGIKASLLNGRLRTNFAVYDYRTSGLQVAVLVGLQQELRNAGKVRTRGAEFDFNYRTPFQGLSLYGALAYEDGKYTDYQATCYRGLPAPQCVTQVNRFTGQPGLLHDLSGTELVRAPDWVGNIGYDFLSPQPVFGSLRLGLSTNFSFSDGFFTDVVSAPGGRQKAYHLLDAGVRLVGANDRWELAFLGRNLTDEHYFTRSADNPFSGSAPGGTGTLLGDTVAVPSRGRELWLRASVKFGR